PGRALQKGDRTGEHGAQAQYHRCAYSQQQTHVVVEGQPRQDGGVRWWELAEVREVARHQLVEVGQHVLVRHHDAGRVTGRSRRVLQIRGVQAVPRVGVETEAGVPTQPVDLDQRRSGL